MTKQLWINLPVKDLGRSKEFFRHLGFKIGDREREDMISLEIGDPKFMVMLVVESRFMRFAENELPSQGTELLLSFDAESREEVDEYARKAGEAGGKVFSSPAEIEGWMYGCGIEDPDGHRWNALYMDIGKAPN